jgi:hypothetical protein
VLLQLPAKELLLTLLQLLQRLLLSLQWAIKQLLLGYTIIKHVSCPWIMIMIWRLSTNGFAGIQQDLLLLKESMLEEGLQTIWKGYK